MRIVFFNMIIYVALLQASCIKDKPNPDIKNIPTSVSNGVLILNEGSFGNNNAEISYLNFENQQVSNSIFKIANGKSLGDVAQCITLINGKYYICVNNSSKIAIVDSADFTLVHTISNVAYPRYIYQYSQDIAFVSSLYRPHVYVLQLSTNTIIDTIFTDYFNTEQLLIANNTLWICNWDTACNYLYKVDVSTYQVQDKVSFGGYAPHDILQDRDGMIWLLSGNKYKNKDSRLTCINPHTNQILKSLHFSSEADPIKLAMNDAKDTLYYINVNYTGAANNNGLYKMGISENSLPSHPFIDAPVNTYFWAFGIDAMSSHLYLSDPKGFTQNSTVYEYTNNGDLIRTFQTGIGSNQFIFK